jgi:hypothetical protein
MNLLWLIGLLDVLLFTGMTVLLAPLKPGILALQCSFTRASFQAVLAAWGEAGLRRYRAHLPVDCVFLLGYAAFGHLWAGQAALPAWAVAWAPWVLTAAAGCDALENLVHLRLARAGVSAAPGWYAFTGTCSVLKWALVFVFAGLALAAAWAGR